MKLALLPYPRKLRRQNGFCTISPRSQIWIDPGLRRKGVWRDVGQRLTEATKAAGIELEPISGSLSGSKRPAVLVSDAVVLKKRPDWYSLAINSRGITLKCAEPGGLHAGVATLRQLLREYGRRIPCVSIEDYADFPRRGVMLDISRGKVPNLSTLLGLVEHLADFKINEFQLYTEHTFAYRDWEAVWGGWGPITGTDLRKLDERCRQLGIDLVPNQNSFGHLRYWLEHPRLRALAEVQEPYEGTGGAFLRYPTTLAPNHPGTLPFLCGLYDELLPHFTSSRFNVGCDETWDLGRGQSKALCEAKGKGRVYLDFLNQIHRETAARGKQMMFWGDIILHHSELIRELPGDSIALNWGYEADHPFDKEAALFASSGISFYVCPGTSTWMTLVGRHDNALCNLEAAAAAGKKHGAAGYLNTDWGDGGHPQPLAVSYAPYLAGAALSWCGETYDPKLLVKVLSRDVFHDTTLHAASAALGMGLAHKRFKYFAPNVTPFGAVIAAPPPKLRELVCRDGLKYYARIPAKNIRAALEELEGARTELFRAQPVTPEGSLLKTELDFASRMAAESCRIMLWQQALAAGREMTARKLAMEGVDRLKALDSEFDAFWPLRNNGTTAKCSAFLRWRIHDYTRNTLHYSPDQARAMPSL